MRPENNNRSAIVSGSSSSTSFEISLKDRAHGNRYKRVFTPEEAKARKNAQTRRWQEQNADHVRRYRKKRYKQKSAEQRAKVRAWYQKNRVHALAKSSIQQLAKFGLTLDDYKFLLDVQNGACAICGVTSGAVDRRLSIDHDHKTLAVRGLLCTRCNFGIGHFLESVQLLKAAVTYLQRPPTKFKLPRQVFPNRSSRKGKK